MTSLVYAARDLSNFVKTCTSSRIAFCGYYDRGCNLAEGGATERSIRTAELRRVQEIESLPAELDQVVLSDPEFLEQCEIHHLVGRDPMARRLLTSVPVLSRWSPLLAPWLAAGAVP